MITAIDSGTRIVPGITRIIALLSMYLAGNQVQLVPCLTHSVDRPPGRHSK